jgi:hypothetical protein
MAKTLSKKAPCAKTGVGNAVSYAASMLQTAVPCNQLRLLCCDQQSCSYNMFAGRRPRYVEHLLQHTWNLFTMLLQHQHAEQQLQQWLPQMPEGQHHELLDCRKFCLQPDTSLEALVLNMWSCCSDTCYCSTAKWHQQQQGLW